MCVCVCVCVCVCTYKNCVCSIENLEFVEQELKKRSILLFYFILCSFIILSNKWSNKYMKKWEDCDKNQGRCNFNIYHKKLCQKYR